MATVRKPGRGFPPDTESADLDLRLPSFQNNEKEMFII